MIAIPLLCLISLVIGDELQCQLIPGMIKTDLSNDNSSESVDQFELIPDTIAPMTISEIVSVLEQEGKWIKTRHPYFSLLDHMIKEQEDIMNATDKDCESVEIFFGKNLISNSFSFIFSDLCNQVFKYHDVLQDEEIMAKYNNKDIDDLSDLVVQKLTINNHLEEDGSHLHLWKNDWIQLGLDDKYFNHDDTSVHQLLSFFIGPNLRRQRSVLYDFMRLDAKYSGDINPLRRFILIIMIEHSGKLLFGKTTKLYDLYVENCGDRSKYLNFWSHAHRDVETGDLFLRNTYLNSFAEKLFYNQVIYDQDEIDLLLKIGRNGYNLLGNNGWGHLDQFYDFIAKEYQNQNIWDFTL